MITSFEPETVQATRRIRRIVAPRNADRPPGPIQVDRSPSPGSRNQGYEVRIDDAGIIRVDGIVLGRRVIREDGRVCLQLCDKDKLRAAQRGTRYPEVVLEELLTEILNHK